MAATNPNPNPQEQVTDLDIIKSWFVTGAIPTQAQFWAAFDSFWHKDQMITPGKIEGLAILLDAKANKSLLDAHITADDAHQTLFDAKVDKEDGKGLSEEDFTTGLKKKLTGIVIPENIAIAGGKDVLINNSFNFNTYFLSPDEGDSLIINSEKIDKLVKTTIISSDKIEIQGQNVTLNAPNGLFIQPYKPVEIYKVGDTVYIIGETTTK